MRILLLILAVLSSGLAHADPQYIGYSDYQIVSDFSFNAPKYFQQMQQNGVNFQRIWVLGYSGSIGDRRHERLPFVRSAGGRYDLSRIDPVYLTRLRNVLEAAGKHDQRVMLTLFDHWSLARKDVFLHGPWYFKNSKQNLLFRSLPDFYDLSNRKLARIQREYVQTIVEATSEFHPIYEIMNEADWKPDCKIVDRWHKSVADWILEVDPNAEIAVNVSDTCATTFEHPWVDVISLHGSQWLNDGACTTVRRYAPLNKQLILDTDSLWKIRWDNQLLSQWLNDALRCGASFNHKDDIYHPDRQALTLMRRAREKLDSGLLQ